MSSLVASRAPPCRCGQVQIRVDHPFYAMALSHVRWILPELNIAHGIMLSPEARVVKGAQYNSSNPLEVAKDRHGQQVRTAARECVCLSAHKDWTVVGAQRVSPFDECWSALGKKEGAALA